MKRCSWKKGSILLILVIIHTQIVWADEPLLIVTDPWPPYVIETDGKLSGADVEITNAVFQKMEMDITIASYPWKRCQMMIRQQTADAILDLVNVPERKKYIYFPEEPISKGITVIFHKTDRRIPYSTLDDLATLNIGAIIGYNYCEVIDNTPFIKNAERVSTQEQNFKKLMAGRLDAIIAVDLVGYYTAKQMGISNQITTIPNASFCHDGNFLGFAQKTGYKKLAKRFSNALKLFKMTDAYKRILSDYGSLLQVSAPKNNTSSPATD